jgi:hypothetical protein
MHGIAIHGHFYQPPREDPWLGTVLRDPTASPGHDWNIRVTRECYLPNAFSSLRDNRGKILSMENNYEHLSFNFGPTLHEWLRKHDPFLNDALREANRKSLDRFGSGNALAQAYNHMILPLASARDAKTQIIWGIRDYRHRYGHAPEGMWLPETAVNTATLEALAEEGIRFTILAPSQCAAVETPEGGWKKTPRGKGLETRRPYRVELPSGKDMAVFFYHGEISHGIAFGELLKDGYTLGRALKEQALPENSETPSLLLVATDGETYGHHHHFTEMALSRAFRFLSEESSVHLLPPGAFLRQHPPRERAKIVENSSWSCVHGIERWRSNCGCSTGGDPSWNQEWRAPLRNAFDRLREEMDAYFEKKLRPFCDDPWKLRNEGVELLLETPPEQFLEQRFGTLPEEGSSCILTLLESQRMGMFLYTSCAWFFNDIAGVETVQNLRYAFRGAELLASTGGPDLIPRLLEDLSKARGNQPKAQNARILAEEEVLPRMRTLEEVAAAAWMTKSSSRYHHYSVEEKESRRFPSRNATVGEILLREPLTGRFWQGCVLRTNPRKEELMVFAGEHLRLQELEGDLFQAPWKESIEAFFPNPPFTLKILAEDDREKLFAEWEEQIMAPFLPLMEENARNGYSMITILLREGAPLPPLLQTLTARHLQATGRELLGRPEDFRLFLLFLNSLKNPRGWMELALLPREVEEHLTHLLDQREPPWEDVCRIMDLAKEFHLEYPKETLIRLFWNHYRKGNFREEPFLAPLAEHLGFVLEESTRDTA